MNRVEKFIATLTLLFAICCADGSTAFGQADTSACGVRATYFVACYCGHSPATLMRTAQLIDLSSDGSSTLLGIQSGLAAMGIKSEGRRLSISQIKHVSLAILAIKTDEGPHFVVYMNTLCAKGIVSLVDAPETMALSDQDFAAKWDGIALIVSEANVKSAPAAIRIPSSVTAVDEHAGTLPIQSPTTNATNPQWEALPPVRELPRVALPLREPIKLTFLIHNTSTQELVIDRLTTSCGCTSATIDKMKISKGDEATVNVVINPAGNNPGWQTYRVAVTSTNNGIPPLLFQAHVQFSELLSIRPLRLYFGNVLHLKKGATSFVDIVEDPDTGVVKVLGISSSVPWIKASIIREGRLAVTISAAVPVGPFREFVSIDTTKGAVNIPISGEGVGSFRLLPNPLLIPHISEDADVEIVRSSDCDLDLSTLKFTFDSSQIETHVLPESTDDRRRIHIHLISADNGISTYNLNVSNPRGDESVDLHIVRGIDP